MEDAPVPCRRCGREMEAGRIYSARWVRWLPASARPPMVWQFGHDELVGVRAFGLRPPTAPALRCPACRLVEFRY